MGHPRRRPPRTPATAAIPNLVECTSSCIGGITRVCHLGSIVTRRRFASGTSSGADGRSGRLDFRHRRLYLQARDRSSPRRIPPIDFLERLVDCSARSSLLGRAERRVWRDGSQWGHRSRWRDWSQRSHRSRWCNWSHWSHRSERRRWFNGRKRSHHRQRSQAVFASSRRRRERACIASRHRADSSARLRAAERELRLRVGE